MSDLFHDVRFSKHTSEQFSFDYLYLIATHSVVSDLDKRCECGFYIQWTEEQVQLIRQLFIRLTESMVWIVCVSLMDQLYRYKKNLV